MRAAGPIGRAVEVHGTNLIPRDDYQLGRDANAQVVLNRLAFPTITTTREGCEVIKFGDEAARALLNWAAATDLGQEQALLRDVSGRRDRAVAALRAAGHTVIRLRVVPEWRMSVGGGNRANAHEIGFSLHGTYGWPIIPGSALKGLTAAYARYDGEDRDTLAEVFGGPRPGDRATRDSAHKGPVTFLDAIPAGQPAQVAVDVLTPHVKPYYDTIEGGDRDPQPPAEHHNPVPVHFLTVTGPFTVELVGRDDTYLELAADWFTKAGADLGMGAKTAAGYGYLTIATVDETPQP